MCSTSIRYRSSPSIRGWRCPIRPRCRRAPGGLEFLTGYLIEKSLSVDNIFIFVLVFGYFAVPSEYQHRVLFFGILGALVFRSIFIAMGAVLIEYKWVVILFGIFLVATGAKMLFAPDKGLEPERNPLIRLFRRFVPVTAEYHGQRFFAQDRREVARDTAFHLAAVPGGN